MSDEGIALVRDLVRRATGAETVAQAAEALRPLFDDTGWLDTLIAAQGAAMRADRLALPGFSATRNGALAHLILAASPRVMIAVSRIGGAIERAAHSEAGSTSDPRVCFSGQQSLWRLLSPGPMPGRLARLEADAQRCRDRAITLSPRAPLVLDERRLALWVAPPDRPVWLLRGRIRRDPAPAMATFSLGSGAPVSRVQGDDVFARAVMLLGVLRVTGAGHGWDAGLALLERARGADRWTVMRELIAIDPARSLPHLRAMADDEAETDAVRQAAREVVERIASVSPAKQRIAHPPTASDQRPQPTGQPCPA